VASDRDPLSGGAPGDADELKTAEMGVKRKRKRKRMTEAGDE